MKNIMSNPTVSLFESQTYRLINVEYYTVPLEAESVTEEVTYSNYAASFKLYRENAKFASRIQISESVNTDKSSQYYKDAAFKYTKISGNRFNDSSRGAWYCALKLQTAIREVGFHFTEELRNQGVFILTLKVQVLLAGIVGEFHDLRHLPRGKGILHKDTAIAYPIGQNLAKNLNKIGSNGIIYPSVRDITGTCLVAFRAQTIKRIRNGGRWQLTWNGSPEFVADQIQEN